MQTENHNLFNALFRFHLRDGYSPWENFLSEAFAYNLRTVAGACNAWCSVIAGTDVKLREWEVFTRNSERDEEGNTTVFPDLKIVGVTAGGEPFRFWAEHKWDSPCNPGQLQTYARCLTKKPGRNLLAFVGALPRQIRDAKATPTDIPCVVLSWEDAYTALLPLNGNSVMLAEFLHFMETHELSPGEPLTTRKMQAFIEATGFINQLWRYADKLLTEYDWPLIPARYTQDKEVKDRWGRVAIELRTKDWAPTITLGFLYSGNEHGVKLTSPESGIDLFVRIETSPSDYPNPAQALAGLAEKVPLVRKLGARVLLKDQPGNDNKHTLLIAQKTLATIIDRKLTEREQLAAIHAELSKWLEALFGDGRLEPALKSITT
jgi:hypothetical protein